MAVRMLVMPALILVLLLLALALVGATLRWLLASQSGSRWLLAHVPGIEVQGFEGALMGERWRADRVRVSVAGTSVTLEGLVAEGLGWQWRPSPQAWIGLDAKHIAAQRVRVVPGPPATEPLRAPADLSLPLRFTLAQAELGRLEVKDQAPVTNLGLQGLDIDPRPGQAYRVERLSAQWQGVLVEGRLQIGHEAPLLLGTALTLRPAADGDAPAWAAVLRLQGPLARPTVDGTLRGVPGRGRPMPALDLHAQLLPFAAWPLGAVSVSTQALDLSSLVAAAPKTQLDGRIEIAPRQPGAPLRAGVEIDNALPGRWNERRLPLRHLSADVVGDLAHRDRVELTRFVLDLGEGREPAGRWSGSADWRGTVLSLNSRLEEVAPQRLDGRAAAMRLSGPLELRVGGLPSPDPGAAPVEPAPRIDWRLDLTGALDAAPQPVRLELEGSADDRRLELRRAQASAGSATAGMTATVQRAGRGEWRVETAGSLNDFDPLPWWPGEAGSAWRQGRHRVSAGWRFDVRLPQDVERLPPLALAQRVVGTGTLNLRDSLLAGVPLALDLNLGYAPAASPSPATLVASASIGGNRLQVTARGDPTGAGAADQLRAELRAERLPALAPIARLVPALAAWAPTQGVANATLSADGRWPDLRSEGDVNVLQLSAGTLSLARGRATWRMVGGVAQPMSLQLDLAGVQWGAQRADLLHAEVIGTPAEHRIEMAANLPLQPPEMLVRLLDVQAHSGTRAQMAAAGAWETGADGGGRWRARIDKLAVGSWDGSAGDAPSASSWVQANNLRAELEWGADGRLATLRAEPGRIRLADAIALRWDGVRVDLRGERAQLELRADVEPFALVPLLSRVQPAMGWQGDLRLAARIDLRAGDRVDADLVLERRDGDLNVAGGEGVRLLGLSELKVALAVHDGNWEFTPRFRGRSLGEIDGTLRVKSAPEQRWPRAEDAIEGSVRAWVADLGIWGAWIPPGWHVGGELRTALALGGSYGQPRVNGSLGGVGLSVRNLLEGINLSDGQVSLRLDGDSATIERFRLRGGEGSIDITGSATLGARPQARLQIQAERFRVLGRVDRLLTASGAAELRLAADDGRLDGAFRVDEGLFDLSGGSAPTLDADVTLRRPGDTEAPAAPVVQAPMRRNFRLDVGLDLGDNLRVRGRGIDARLRGNVRLGNAVGNLGIDGTIATDRGTYAAYGQKLDIERGEISFTGPPADPRLDVLALRPNLDTRVGVLITGTALTPRVRLYSDPEMGETDKLAWLLLGRAPDTLGRSDATLMQRAAVALLAGEGEAPTDALTRRLGLDEVSLRQTDTDARDTVITLGKQLSSRWYVGYERGVNATTGTWQLIYRIAQRFTLRLQSGLENSLDVIWVWRLGESAPAVARPAARSGVAPGAAPASGASASAAR